MLKESLIKYRTLFPREEETAKIAERLASEKNPTSRSRMDFHITSSAFVFSPNLEKVLLIRHRALNRWLQPGGHVEDGETPWESARREVEEEAGLKNAKLHRWHEINSFCPVDIDIHSIPERPDKGEDKHQHIDLRYMMMADGNNDLTLQVDEVFAAEWCEMSRLNSVTTPLVTKRIARIMADHFRY